MLECISGYDILVVVEAGVRYENHLDRVDEHDEEGDGERGVVEHPQRLVLLLVLQIFVLFGLALLGGVAPHFERPDEEEDDSVQCLRRDQYSGQRMDGLSSSLFSPNLAITLVTLHLCEGWDVDFILIYSFLHQFTG